MSVVKDVDLEATPSSIFVTFDVIIIIIIDKLFVNDDDDDDVEHLSQNGRFVNGNLILNRPQSKCLSIKMSMSAMSIKSSKLLRLLHRDLEKFANIEF